MFRESHYKRLDDFIAAKLRVILKGAATEKPQDAHMRTMSNMQVMKNVK